MAKKSLKALSTAALAAAFTTSAIVPAAVASAETPAEATLEISHYVVEIDGKAVQISAADFVEMKAAGKIEGSAVKFVKANDVVYTLADFTAAKASLAGSNPTQEDVLKVLAETEGAAQDVELYEAAIGEDGTISAGDKVAAPAEELLKAAEEAVAALPTVEEVKVEDKAAVEAAAAKVAAAKEAGADVTELQAKVDALVEKIAKLEAAPSVESVKAVSAKTLEVTFNKEVDTAKAKLEVVKSTIKQNVSKTTWSADNKSVTLELSTKLTKGEYIVNVTGLTDAALTKSVQVEDEKVDSIEILSDVAVVDDSTTPGQATVSYQVKNQYGEDITKTTALTTNNANVSAANGVVTLDNLDAAGAEKKVGDKLPITLIHVESAKSATKVVTLSASATVSDVEIKGIYNKDGKALNEDSKVADGYYLLVDLKDQYGNALTNTNAASGLIVAESNPTVVGLDGTAPDVNLTQLTIDGKKQLAVKLDAIAKAGESQVTLISKTSGKSAVYKVTVAETTRADVVQLSAPALAVADEDVYIPASVLDKEGKAITDPKVLNNATKGVTLNLDAEFVTKDEALFVKVPKAQVATKGVYSLLAQSATNKVATLTINVKEAAEATVIRGLKSTVSSTIKAGTNKTIDASDLVVEDQYGRVIDSADVKASLTGGKKIVVKKADANASEITINAANITDGATAQITAGSANGTETLQFVLHDGSKEIVSSTAEVTVRVTDGSEYASYEVAEVGTVYDEKGADVAKTSNDVDYDKAVKVYGVLADGSKVLLTNGTDYALSSTNTDFAADLADNGVINATASYAKYDTDAKTAKLPLTVTINATGEKFNQEVTFSKVAPKVTKVDVVANNKGADLLAGKSVSALEKFDFTTAGTFSIAQLLTNADVVVTDQYGAKVDLVATGNKFADDTTIVDPTLTFTKVAGDLVFTANGTKDAVVTTKEANSVFNTTVTVGAVDAAPVKVTATEVTP